MADETPKPESTELTPLSETNLPAALADMNVDAQNRVDYAIEVIADLCLSPAPPGQPWAGRDEVVAKVVEKFDVLFAEAIEIVREAQVRLWSQTQDDDAHVQRELMLCRLRVLLRTAQQAMNTDIVEVRENVEKDQGTGKLIATPFRRKITKGPHQHWVRLNLMIQAMIGELLGARQSQNDDSIERWMELVASEGGKAEVRTGQKVKTSIKGMSEEAKKNLLAMTKRRPVNAKRKEKEGSGDGG